MLRPSIDSNLRGEQKLAERAFGQDQILAHLERPPAASQPKTEHECCRSKMSRERGDLHNGCTREGREVRQKAEQQRICALLNDT